MAPWKPQPEELIDLNNDLMMVANVEIEHPGNWAYATPLQRHNRRALSIRCEQMRRVVQKQLPAVAPPGWEEKWRLALAAVAGGAGCFGLVILRVQAANSVRFSAAEPPVELDKDVRRLR